MGMTKSQINKLGDVLRAAGPPKEEVLLRLQELRASYDPPMTAAQMLLKNALGIDATSRLKTVNTIVEKLRRDKTRLAEMQDIAGLRVVADIGLAEQTVLAEKVSAIFATAKVVDRREKPRYGYRAVHVVAVVDGYPVEIQIRTKLQDLWAQALERLADEVGRGIRYGEPAIRRSEEVSRLRGIADLIAGIELARKAYGAARRAVESRPQDDDVHGMLERLRTALDEASEQLRIYFESWHSGAKP